MLDYDGIAKRIENTTEFELLTDKLSNSVSREGKFIIELREGEESDDSKTIWESYTVIFFLEKFRNFKQEWTYLSNFVQKIFWTIRSNKAAVGIVDMILRRWRKVEEDNSSITRIEMDIEIKTLMNRG
jgi:hypothetical protein